MPTEIIPSNIRDLCDDKAAADILDVSPGTLSVWRSTGRYNLPFVKIGRKVRYRKSDWTIVTGKQIGRAHV